MKRLFISSKRDSRQEDNARWTANRDISPGEGQQACLLINSEGRDVIAVLIAGIHKSSARGELDVPGVIAHGGCFPDVMQSTLAVEGEDGDRIVEAIGGVEKPPIGR